MPLLDIRASEMNVKLGRTLSRVPQDLLKYGRGATGLDPEGPGGGGGG
ncbi:MAG: hypothetical protein WBF13_07145 [Candidatus Zixiibacteriota bacterium]